jgi:hypothetical protein
MKAIIFVAAAVMASVWSLAAQSQENAPMNQSDSTYPRSVSTDTTTQPTQQTATPEATQAVGGTTPMSSQSGAGTAPGPRGGIAPSLFDQVFRGN